MGTLVCCVLLHVYYNVLILNIVQAYSSITQAYNHANSTHKKLNAARKGVCVRGDLGLVELVVIGGVLEVFGSISAFQIHTNR